MLRPGSWIGGDRDGNPNVTAEVVAAGHAAAPRTPRWRTTSRELTALEEELSMSARLVALTAELAALADGCGDDRRPRRRALPAGAAR